MVITIRHATIEDGDVLGEIHADSWGVAYAPFFEPAFAAGQVSSRRTRWHARLSPLQDTILVAEGDGRPLALSWFGPSKTVNGIAEVHGFYAHPDGWGTGVAPALMTATLAQLKNDGFTRAHLWTLRDTPQSRRFYTKSGFAETGAERDHDFGDGRPLIQVEFSVDL
ncbi:GNAT family N-acetyltransferase [Nonomuraea endophytica]|uniref:RimJ/RimL family protein N-acetyltransferase n=1 Tax=Nonomuraea endophytica TaxID=714136 RepID=A0A7W7ZXZ3_9ACTN|nr:GNAT family N-acetyltransferase [Nonomuraea endophytica]MBB5075321.1 RimJ/RimL family protein N-acetyltransferase [Nonomuraea endophytica]